MSKSVLAAVRDGRVVMHRTVKGGGAGPQGDFYGHRTTIDGRPLTAPERVELHRLCLNLDASPPRLPNGPGSGPYEARR